MERIKLLKELICWPERARICLALDNRMDNGEYNNMIAVLF
jgi:hypothetical protein